jgi:pimeloyl-ACP methyl ester carboxylesterase
MYSQRFTFAVLSLFSVATATRNASVNRITTDDGTNYVYDYAPAQEGKPTFLLIHGYPGTRHDWHGQVADLSAAGYGVIAPDCLGYGESDLPTEVEAYDLKRIAGHLAEILNQEDIGKVIGVGHDWGANTLSRTSLWQRERFEKVAFLSVGYSAPGVFIDVDALNAFGLSQLGYMQLGYFYFFNSYNAADLAAKNVCASSKHVLWPYGLTC